MKGCYCVNGYLFYWLRPALLFIQIFIVKVLTVQHRDTVTMLQVHQESCVGPHYNQCHQRSVAVIVSTSVLTSSNLAEQSSCAGWHGTMYTHQPGRTGTGWNSVGQLTYASIQPSRCFMVRCYRFSSDVIILEEQVLLYQRFLLHILVLGFLTTRK